MARGLASAHGTSDVPLCGETFAATVATTQTAERWWRAA
jgi:hypothetical protein